MRAVTSGWIAFALVGCSKPADKPAEDAVEVAAASAEAASGAISLADVAGTWSIRSTVRGTEKVITYDMTATGNDQGWSIKFPDRDPIPVRIVAVAGDSIVSESGPFESVLRKGMQVNARVVSRLQGDKMVGTTTASYDVSGADSVTMLDFEGTRKQ